MTLRTHFVYRAWDAEDRPLYVGCSGNIDKRRAGHRSTSEWYPYAVRFDLIGPFEKAVALKREQDQIITLRPLFNALPEHALMTRRRNRRISELTDRMYKEAGLLTREQISDALLADADVLRPIWAASEAIADAEFDLRCTHLGRIRNYRILVGEVAA